MTNTAKPLTAPKKTTGIPMMMNTTIEQLRDLRLPGMATGLQEQLSQAGMTALSFEERLSLLVDREVHWRNDKRQARLLKDAKLNYSQASIEDLNTGVGRGLERKAVVSLALGDWIASGHSVLITGATGVGKSWLACALAQYACRRGNSAFYQRVPRLSEELRIRHGNGTFGKWLLQLAKTDVLLLMIGAWQASTARPVPTCWKSLTTGPPTRPPSSPANCLSSIGMPGSATQPSPTPCWTV
jgi:DNA replication protein DnaC